MAPTRGVSRREPSDVLEVDGTYYCWYTKVADEDPLYPTAYGGTVWYATSEDGVEWTERGRALDADERDAWDGRGVFTPNARRYGDAFYLFYTGVADGFSNEYPEASGTAVGVAVAEAPDGPWERHGANPVLEPGPEWAWDSFRVDDACPVARGDRYHLYYKGVRQFADNWPAHTPHGVAVADDPLGPYEKAACNPVYAPGHADALWPDGDGGVVALVQGDGVYYSPDGRAFERRAAVERDPWAPGVHRGGGVTWGLSQVRRADEAATHGEASFYLRRFDCDPPLGGSDRR